LRLQTNTVLCFIICIALHYSPRGKMVFCIIKTQHTTTNPNTALWILALRNLCNKPIKLRACSNPDQLEGRDRITELGEWNRF